MRPAIVWGLLALALTLYSASQSLADEGASHDGTVVSASAGKLTMKDATGKEHSHDIGPTVKITVNGKPGKLEDLTAGMRIRVTTDDKQNVLTVTTIDTEKWQR